jgi:hypothetical protein
VLAPITRPVEPGVLPADTLARAFRDDTALIVLPIRLTGLYFNNRPPGGELTFCFRCTMRGGALEPESRAAFFDAPLPAGLPARYRRQVEQALHHPGGSPHMEHESKGLGARLGHLLGARAAISETTWAAKVKLVVDASHKQVVWQRAASGGPWRLPVAAVSNREAPWEAAARLLKKVWSHWGGRLSDLRLVELARERPAITFVFAASLYDAPFPRVSTETVAFVQAGQLTKDFLQNDVAVVDRVTHTATPLIRLEDEPS